MCLNIRGILVNAEPNTMTVRNVRERTADVHLKMPHWMFRNIEGGPYSGSGGNRGFVLLGGIAFRNVPSPDFWIDPFS
jgi:hypothetical protein